MSRLQLVPVNLQSRTTDPTTPTLRAGDMYWNSTAGEIRVYTGSAWVAAAFASNTLTLTNKTLTSPTINTPTLTLSTSTSTTDGVIAWDATNDQLKIGNGSTTSTISPDDKAATLSNKSISGSTNTLSNIPNSALTNSSITINGVAVALGGSTTVTSPTDWVPSLLLGGM